MMTICGLGLAWRKVVPKTSQKHRAPELFWSSLLESSTWTNLTMFSSRQMSDFTASTLSQCFAHTRQLTSQHSCTFTNVHTIHTFLMWFHWVTIEELPLMILGTWTATYCDENKNSQIEPCNCVTTYVGSSTSGAFLLRFDLRFCTKKCSSTICTLCISRSFSVGQNHKHCDELSAEPRRPRRLCCLLGESLLTTVGPTTIGMKTSTVQ